MKIFSDNPRLGFLTHARVFSDSIAAGTLPAGAATLEAARRMVFNDRLDAAVAAFFMISVIVIIVASTHEWLAVLSGRKRAVSTEVGYSRTQDFAMQATGGS
jgi:carbon starvation protein